MTILRTSIRSAAFAAVAISVIPKSMGAEPTYFPPKTVRVLPVVLVPKGARDPKRSELELLSKHLTWSQTRYREMLGGQDTFSIEKDNPDIVPLSRPLSYYRKLPKPKAAPAWTDEVLTHYELSRFNCPYVFLMVVMNDQDRFPVGGGRPINGGINRGGGILVISMFALTKMPNFQSTLRHELGHAFGLPHVNVYGYDMKSNRSIMSYNPRHKTNGLRESKSPGVLIAEDLRALSLNRRVFSKLKSGPKLAKRIVTLGPMEIPNRPNYELQVTTTAGEKFGSAVKHITGTEIEPSKGPGITYNPKTMWHSDTLPNGEATLELQFPLPVELGSMSIHSQHSGKSHAATHAAIEAMESGRWTKVASQSISVDALVEFQKTTAEKWRIRLRSGPSRKIVLRGLRFFSGEVELFSTP